MDKLNFKMRKNKCVIAALALSLFVPRYDALAAPEVPAEESTTQESAAEYEGTNENASTEEGSFNEGTPEAASTEELPYNEEASNEVPSNEGYYNNEAEYTEESVETPAGEGNTAGTEVYSPYINGVSVSGRSFEPGDLVTVTVEGTNSTVLSAVTATFQKASSAGNTTIDISSFNVTELGNGNFTAVATYQLPANMADTSYTLTGITLADQAGNNTTISNADMNLDAGFEVISPVPEDTVPPNLVTMYTDREVYAPGETVTVTVEAEDESEISQMSGAFMDAGGSADASYRLENIYITQNPVGNYVGVGTFVIAEDAKNATYNLDFVGMSDVHGNESYFNQYDFGVSFDIMNDAATETDPPELVDISADKESYQAGETVNVEVTATDENDIIGVTADFVVEGEEEGKVYSTDLDSIEQDKEGNFIASVKIQLPEKLAGKKVLLQNITLVDVYENIGEYNTEADSLDLSFEVTEADDSGNVPGDGVAAPGKSGEGDDAGNEEESTDEIAAADGTKGGFLPDTGIFSEKVLLPVVILLIFGCTVLFAILPLRKK